MGVGAATSARLAALADGSPRRVAWALFLGVGLVYLLTAGYSGLLSPDPIAAAIPAWHLVHTGSPYLEATGLKSPWFFTSAGHLVSDRIAGVVWFGVPFYGLFGLLMAPFGGGHFTLVPAAFAGATAASGAVSVVYVLLRELVRPRLALIVALVFAFGTPTWSVSANSLWPHGPAQLWLVLGLLLAVRGRFAWSGLVLGLAVATRLHFAVVALVLGVWLAVSRRSLRPLLGLGVSAWALPAFFVWNHWVYGGWSLLHGSYEGRVGSLESTFSAAPGALGPQRYLVNLAGTLVAPNRGLLWWTPALIVLAAGLPWAWRQAPDWVRAAVVGGLAYLAIQLKVNGFSGGMNFYGYRLALEAVTLAMPLLALAVASPAVWGTVRRQALVLTSGFQVTVIALGAVLPLPTLWAADLSWRFWQPAFTLYRYPVGGGLIILLGGLATGAAFRWARGLGRPAPDQSLVLVGPARVSAPPRGLVPDP